VGKADYFGADLQAALKKWAKLKDDLLAGRVPQNADGLTVGKLCNLFLSHVTVHTLGAVLW